MAAIDKSICMLLIAVVLAVATAPHIEAAIGCVTVVSHVQSCLPYVTNKGPIGDCCGGVKGLYAAAKTKADRQSVCGCLKSLAGTIECLPPGPCNCYPPSDSLAGTIECLPPDTCNCYPPQKVAALAGQCGVNLPYNISPSTDCSKVN